ncbi:MAG: tryptophan synthase subunit alpha [Candidatus Glassbacteria bacterium]
MLDIESRLKELKDGGGKALIPFFTIGYPDMGTSLELIRAASEAGADIIEVGIPFSDPIADGPSIQFSSQEALKNGTTLHGALRSLKRITKDLRVPIVIMSYYNPILSMGPEQFSEAAARVPVSGVIVPDLPPEEGGELRELLRDVGIDTIYLIAPTSTRQRIEMIASLSGGFIYAVSVTGVTGARSELPAEISSFLTGIKRATAKPVCVGFGISTKEQAKLLAPQADGIIIGSAIVDIIRKNRTDPIGPVADYLKEMKGVLV